MIDRLWFLRHTQTSSVAQIQDTDTNEIFTTRQEFSVKDYKYMKIHQQFSWSIDNCELETQNWEKTWTWTKQNFQGLNVESTTQSVWHCSISCIQCRQLTVPVNNLSWTRRLPVLVISSPLLDNAARFNSPFTDYTTLSVLRPLLDIEAIFASCIISNYGTLASLGLLDSILVFIF